MNAGKSVRLFLADGTPGGLVTAEIMNWTGHVLMSPRSALSGLLKREESSRTGIYILFGESPESVDGVQIYIGEGDDVSARLRSHEASKDFWDRVVVLTSKDKHLTKAHVRFLESRLINAGYAATPPARQHRCCWPRLSNTSSALSAHQPTGAPLRPTIRPDRRAYCSNACTEDVLH